MRRLLAITLCLGLFAWWPASVMAWNKPGHMVSGAIAYLVLKQESPDTLEKVLTLLKEHPYYESHWQPRLASIPADDRDMFLFMMAARWPDDARSDEEFHHAEWHYINFPFKPEGQPRRIRTAEPESSNILRALATNLDVLKRTDEDAEKRAVALAWLFHLVGDLQQPLHTATLFTTEFPRGDRGATRFYIRVREDSSAISLHQFWDDLIIGSDRVRSVKNRATELRLRPEFARDRLTELREASFDKWAAESFNLAKEVAYRHGRLEGSPDRSEAVKLPDDYPSTAKPIAERRIVLAGYRLADLLKRTLE